VAIAGCFGAGVATGVAPKAADRGQAAATAAAGDATGRDTRPATTVATGSRMASFRRSIPDAATSTAAVGRSGGAVARGLLNGLHEHVRRARQEVGPHASAEAVAVAHPGTFDGWVDAIRYTSPQVIADLRAAIEESFCSGAREIDELLMTAKVLQWLPEAASTGAFECFFQSTRREDTAFWYVLDAWRVSGLEPPPSVAAIKSWATDARTLRRLEPLDAPAALERAGSGVPRAGREGEAPALPR
jgi:hypothetical protein